MRSRRAMLKNIVTGVAVFIAIPNTSHALPAKTERVLLLPSCRGGKELLLLLETRVRTCRNRVPVNDNCELGIGSLVREGPHEGTGEGERGMQIRIPSEFPIEGFVSFENAFRIIDHFGKAIAARCSLETHDSGYDRYAAEAARRQRGLNGALERLRASAELMGAGKDWVDPRQDDVATGLAIDSRQRGDYEERGSVAASGIGLDSIPGMPDFSLLPPPPPSLPPLPPTLTLPQPPTPFPQSAPVRAVPVTQQAPRSSSGGQSAPTGSHMKEPNVSPCEDLRRKARLLRTAASGSRDLIRSGRESYVEVEFSSPRIPSNLSPESAEGYADEFELVARGDSEERCRDYGGEGYVPSESGREGFPNPTEQQQSDQQRCMVAYLRDHYGDFVTDTLVPYFSLGSMASKTYWKSILETGVVKGSILGALGAGRAYYSEAEYAALGKSLTEWGWPGIMGRRAAIIGASGRVAYIAAAQTFLEWIAGVVATGGGAFASAAHAMAYSHCASEANR